jgi:hypothetical protein
MTAIGRSNHAFAIHLKSTLHEDIVWQARFECQKNQPLAVLDLADAVKIAVIGA